MIIVRAPLRVSFAGGGTDMPEYYRHEFGAVCSMAIDKYVYVTVNNLSTYFPHRFRVAYSQTELTQESSAIRHPIVREALQSLHLHGGIDINVMADIPAGTGMGSSSTFTVALLHALNTFRHKLVNKETLAREASRLEIDVLREPIGKQDQYAAAFGGIHLFKFLPDERVEIEPLPISAARRDEITQRLMLFYLGGNRQASSILGQQSSNVAANRPYLDELRAQALRTSQLLAGEGPVEELGELLREGWELKKNLATGITRPEVDAAIETARRAGALGGKLLGAGGTGFLLFVVPEGARDSVGQALASLAEVPFHIDDMGSTLLYYGNS